MREGPAVRDERLFRKCRFDTLGKDCRGEPQLARQMNRFSGLAAGDLQVAPSVPDMCWVWQVVTYLTEEVTTTVA
jgi:hypothetical protein